MDAEGAMTPHTNLHIGLYETHLPVSDVGRSMDFYETLGFRLGHGSQIRSEAVNVQIPARRTELVGNYPNPFNPSTEIRLVVANREHVSVSILDVQGRLVRTLADEVMDPGARSVIWDGQDDAGRGVASGSYVVRLQTDSVVDSRTVVLLK